MADVAVRAVGTPVTGTGTTLTPTIPTGTLDGDLMVAFRFIRGGGSYPSTETGWTNLSYLSFQTGNILGTFCYRFKQAGDGNPTFDFTNAGAETVCAFIISFYNVNTTTPSDVVINFYDFSAPGSPYDVTLAGFNTNTNGAFAIYGWVSLDDNTWVYQSGGGAGLVAANATDATDMSICVAGESIPTAGGTGDQVAQQTTKQADAGGLFYFAIKPSGAASIDIGTGGTFAQATKVTEVLAAAVSAQPTIEISSPVQTAKATEVLGTLVLPPDIAIISPVQTAKATEVITASASTPIILTTDKTETVKLTEILAGAVEAQVTLGASATQSAKLTEALATSVSVQQEVEIESVFQTAKITEALSTEVEAAPALETLLIQVAQAAHFSEWFSPDFKEVIGISDSLQAVVEALIGDVDVSTPVQVAKASEVITAVVVAQTALEASATQAGKATESLAASVVAQVDLSAGATQAAKATEVLGGSVTAQTTLAVDKIETIKATENLAGAVTTQTTLGISSTDNAKITEVLAGALSAAVTLAIDKTESAKVTEVLSGAVSASVTLTTDKTDAVKVSEALTGAVEAPVTLAAALTDTVRLTEAKTVAVEGLISDLEVSIAEVCRASDATASEVLAQVAVELAAIDSVAVVTTDLAVSIEAAVSAVRGRFRKIPGSRCISGGFTCIPGDTPVDSPDMERI